MKDVIVNVGKTNNNCTVHWIKGLGYWICPTHVQLYVDTNNKIRATALHNGKRRSRCLNLIEGEEKAFTRQDLDDLIRPVLDFIYPHIYLCRYRGRWLEQPERMITECTVNDERREIYLQVPQALSYESETIRIGRYDATDTRRRGALYDRALARAKALVEEFKLRFKVSNDDIFTFHKENPATRENRQARR